MIRFGNIHKSFIPYLSMLILLLVFILVLDNHAENVSSAPQQFMITSGNTSESLYNGAWIYAETSSPGAGKDISNDSLYLRARADYREENYQQSKERFTLLSKKYPDHPLPYNYLGIIAMRERNYPDADRNFKSSLDNDSSYVSALVNLAILRTRMLRYTEAESLYKKAIQQTPNNPNIHQNLGMLYKRMERWNLAGQAFLRSIELSSGERKAMAYCQYGNTRLQLYDTAGARESFEQAILYKPDYELARICYTRTLKDENEKEAELLKIHRLNPRSHFANFYLGKLYAERAETGKAEVHLQNALASDPYDEQTIDALSNLMIEQGRLEEARMVLSGLESTDTLPQYYFYQAKLAVRENKIDSAIRHYQQAIDKSAEEYPEASLNLAILYKQRNQTDLAIQSYEEAIQSRPDYSLAFYNLALLYSEIDSTERAIQCYRQSIEKDRYAYKSWYNMALLLDDLDETEKAEEAFRQSLHIRPDYIKALMSLGNLYLNREDHVRAISRYRELVNQYPNYSKAWFNLGLAYSRIDQTDDAINAYERLIEIDPDNVRARINLGVIYARRMEYEQAIYLFQDAMDLDMSNPDIRFNLALQYERTGEMEKAKYQYYKTLDLDPAFDKAYDHLHAIHTAEGDDRGLIVLRYYQSLAEPDPDSLYEIGKSLHDLGEINLAMEAYLKAEASGFEGKWLEYWIGKAHMDRLEFNDAIRQFETVLSLDKEHKFALYRLGQTYELLNKPGRANDFYEALLQIDPGFRIVHKSPLEDG